MTNGTKSRDAIALLKADHKAVKDLFNAYEDADGESEKKALVARIIKELKIHSAIEEELFYPAVRAAIEDPDLVDEADEEHRLAKTIIEELSQEEPAQDHFDAKVIVLAESIRHHIKEEEGEMFKKVRSADIDLDDLGEKLAARKEELMANESALDEAVADSDVKPYQELTKV